MSDSLPVPGNTEASDPELEATTQSPVSDTTSDQEPVASSSATSSPDSAGMNTSLDSPVAPTSDNPVAAGEVPSSQPAVETAADVAPQPVSELTAEASSESVPQVPSESTTAVGAESTSAPAAESPTEIVASNDAAPAHMTSEAEATSATTKAEPPIPVITNPTIVGHISSEDFARMQEEERKRREEERERKEAERKAREEAFAVLAQFKENNGAFEITVQERVKGGLRGEFNGLRVFLPASHFGLRKNVPEDELAAAVGSKVRVKVHELQSDEAGYKSAVVSRREILQEEFWSGIEPGTVHEGVVTSVTNFGAFVNIGGVEGLVHISRLSRSRVNSAEEVVKKGDRLRVTIVEVDREKRKLSLSHKEHEADPWTSVEEMFPIGTVLKGVVRRITDFGAYVQVAARIEGLLRVSELSWTQRVKHPSDMLSVGQEIEVAVLEVNAAKHQLSLGYKQTQHNPWVEAAEQLPVGSTVKGVVQQVSSQGAVIRVNGLYDGFMPRSKMTNVGPGRKITMNMGDEVDCVVVDVNPSTASLILAMPQDDSSAYSSDFSGGGYHDSGPSEGGRGDRRRDRDRDRGKREGKGDRRKGRDEDDDYSSYDGGTDSGSSGVTLGDLLKETDKTRLNR